VKPMTVLDDEYLSLWYHPKGNIIHHKTKTFLPQGVFKRLLTTGAEILEEHGATKWLSDERDNVVAAPEDLQWSDETWHPRVINAGLKHWAIVVPSKAVAALQMKKLRDKRRSQGLIVELFETTEEAMAWLESQP
jgi:hypothetical protein